MLLPNLSASWKPNRSHPLNNGLIALAAFTEGAGVPAVHRGSVIGGALPLQKNSSPTWTAGVAAGLLPGRSYAGLPGSGDDWWIRNVSAAGATDPIPAGRVTYAFIRIRGGTSNTNTLSFGTYGPGAGERAGGHVPYSDGVIYWDFGTSSSPNRLTWSGYSASTAIETWVFVAGSRGSAIYFNGLQKASQGTGISRTQSGEHVGMNSGNGVSTSEPNNMLFFGIFNAEWTAADVAQWHADPYALIEQYDDNNMVLLDAVIASGKAMSSKNATFRSLLIR
jgi:hypothetical protein